MQKNFLIDNQYTLFCSEMEFVFTFTTLRSLSTFNVLLNFTFLMYFFLSVKLWVFAHFVDPFGFPQVHLQCSPWWKITFIILMSKTFCNIYWHFRHNHISPNLSLLRKTFHCYFCHSHQSIKYIYSTLDRAPLLCHQKRHCFLHQNPEMLE